MNENLPAYTQPSAKQALIDAGCSGTVYSLVMPESENVLSYIVDGGAGKNRDGAYLGMYREPWTQKQDSAHVDYFDTWIRWSSPVLGFSPEDFQHRYPTAGASEGIFKLMSEYVAVERANQRVPTIHMFEGDYEGYSAFANSLQVNIVRHQRNEWRQVPERLADTRGQFWISQPAAIDGEVWAPWSEFIGLMNKAAPDIEIIPDLTYVGSVADNYFIELSSANIAAFVFSHSKPMGGYYHRVGGVFAREMRPSLFGNIWFKNLQSLAWGAEMMRRNPVQYLPARYRTAQQEAAVRVGRRLGITLKPAAVLLLATADASEANNSLLSSLVRGSTNEARIRLCITPEMDGIIRAS